MQTYVVITQMNADGEILPAGALIREDRFTAERIERQLALGLIALVPQDVPEEPASAAPASARKSPAAAKE